MRKLLVLALCCFLWGCGGKNATVNGPKLNEPDKDLYVTARKELDHNHYDRARLLLNTLINTYPDSEFLPQAKYATAESFYNEGTKAMLEQADAAFRDYIIFFPETDKSDDAQLMVAMTHIRQIQKADRDSTQARLAEAELKKMIKEYPSSDLLDEAKEKLREVQEQLAKGISGIAHHYYIRKAYAASASRYKDVWQNYPDFSQIDDTLFYLAESLRRGKNIDESGEYYARLVSEHPMSPHVSEAKEHLAEMKLPIPEPNPVALARAREKEEGPGMFGRVLGLVHSRPTVSTDTGAASIRNEPIPEGTPGNFQVEPNK